MFKRPVLVSVLAPCLLVAASCADAVGVDPAPHSEVTSGAADVRLVDEKHADLLLYVSNQSFDDQIVGLTVEVDGVTVVDDEFHVENQHNWVGFPLSMPAGAHEITAESDSGATLTERFEVPGDATHYAVIEHWVERGSAELTWSIQEEPIGFA